MEDHFAQNYEIKVSKTNNKVPVINGIHLHSVYNPIKEAENFARQHEKQLENSKNVVILGLAFGYHVNEISNLLQRYHSNDFNIIVIEPFSQIADDASKLGLIHKNANIKILSSESISDLYNNNLLLDLLTKRPAVIAHPASFNLSRKYFQKFLTYKASTFFKTLTKYNLPKEISSFLHEFNKEESIDDYINGLKTAKSDSRCVHLLNILKTIKEQTSEVKV